MTIRPSHRDPDEPAPEVCEVTGVLVNRSSLVVSEVRGLRGRAVSGLTPFLRRARSTPGYHDYREWGQRVTSEEHDPPVIGGKLWWQREEE